MMAILYSHPQVYVDIASENWGLPRREFHRYKQRLVEAGFGQRILFGFGPDGLAANDRGGDRG